MCGGQIPLMSIKASLSRAGTHGHERIEPWPLSTRAVSDCPQIRPFYQGRSRVILVPSSIFHNFPFILTQILVIQSTM